MHGMAQAVGELTEQGSPAFEAAVPILSQLLKAETGRQRGQIDGLSAQGRPLPELSRSRRLRLSPAARSTRRSHVNSIAASSWKTPTMSSWSARPIPRHDAHLAMLLKRQAPVDLAQLISGVAWTLRSAERPAAPDRTA